MKCNYGKSGQEKERRRKIKCVWIRLNQDGKKIWKTTRRTIGKVEKERKENSKRGANASRRTGSREHCDRRVATREYCESSRDSPPVGGLDGRDGGVASTTTSIFERITEKERNKGATSGRR